jgi:L-lactate dehydrogenase complex protein LldE
MVHVLKIKLEDLGDPIKVTWHTSWHAKRVMEIGNAPKQLLGQLKNVELLELEREDECCGYGGTFAIKEQHIYAAMVKDKLDEISKTATNRHL